MFDMVDIDISLHIDRLLIQESSKVKESSLLVISSAHTAFLLCGLQISRRAKTDPHLRI